MEEKLSWLRLKPHLKIMRSLGFYYLEAGASKTRQLLQKIIMLASLAFPIIYVVQGSIFVYQVRSNADKVMDSLFILLSFTDHIYKQLVMWTNHETIEKLLNIMKGPLFNQGNETHKAILKNRVRESKLFKRIFHTMIHTTCTLLTIRPFVDYLHGKEVELSIWMPYSYNTNERFYFVLFYTWVQTEWLGYNNTTMDMFISGLMSQCTVQIKILRLDLESLVKISKEYATQSNIALSRALDEKFRNLLLHYEEIIKFSNYIVDAFSGAIFFQFIATCFILCASTYRTVNMNPATVEFVSMVLYLNGILFELSLYCFFGNQLAFESELLTESVYNVDWLEVPLKIRKSLILFMERAKRPILLKAWNMVPVSAKTLINILRCAYSFYTFLAESSE